MTHALLPRSTWTSRGPVKPLTPLDPSEVRGLAVHWPGSPGRWGPVPTLQDTARRLEDERRQHTSPSSSDPSKPWSDLAYCVPTSVEALTDSGWKNHDEITDGDLLYTLNRDTGMGEWQSPSAINVFSGPRTMLRGRWGLLSTPNHKWPTLLPKTGRYKLTDSARLSRHHRVPGAARNASQPETAKYADDFVALVAWFWTEGHICKSRGKQTRSVAIYQSHTANPDNVRSIASILTRLYGPESAFLRQGKDGTCSRGHALVEGNLYSRGRCRTCTLEQARGPLPQIVGPPRWSIRRTGKKTTFYLNATIGADLLAIAEAPDKVVRTDFLLDLTHSQLELFIAVSIAADGFTGPNGGPKLLQKIDARTESFAFACVLAGKPISYMSYTPPGRTPMTGISILVSGHRRIVDDQMDPVEFDGDVWCPTTPNRTWLARHGRKVFFTGNSMAVDLAGRLFEARGLQWRPAANGDAAVNRRYLAVTVLMGAGDTVTTAAVDAVRAARAAVLARYPHAVEVVGHRDLHATDCPGDQLYRLVRSGAFTAAPGEDDDMPTADEVADVLLRRIATAATPGRDQAADAAVYAIARRVWTVGWPAGTAQEPDRQETAQERLVWAARGSALAGAVDSILGALRGGQPATLADETVQALADAIVAKLPAGMTDAAGVAAAVRAELAAALAAK